MIWLLFLKIPLRSQSLHAACEEPSEALFPIFREVSVTLADQRLWNVTPLHEYGENGNSLFLDLTQL